MEDAKSETSEEKGLPSDEDLDTSLILAELLEISNRSASSRFHSRSNNSKTETLSVLATSSSISKGAKCHHDEIKTEMKNDDESCCNTTRNGNNGVTSAVAVPCEKSASDTTSSTTTLNAADLFLECHLEKVEMNQYWYSQETIKSLCEAISEVLSTFGGSRVAFLSTPSLYFAFPLEARKQCSLFDIDKVWENDFGYQYYDFNNPEKFDDSLRNAFDVVVIDPPFITKDVWKQYSKTAKALLKYSPFRDANVNIAKNTYNQQNIDQKDDDDDPFLSDENRKEVRKEQHRRGYVFATTVAENETLMGELFDAKPTVFKPNIPNLVYQYEVYTNCFEEHCRILNKQNPEICLV